MVRNRPRQRHIEQKVLDAELLLGKGFVETKPCFFKQLLCVVIDPALFECDRIGKLIAIDLSGKHRDRNSALLIDHKHGTGRIFIPSGRKIDSSAHDPVGLQQIIKLII